MPSERTERKPDKKTLEPGGAGPGLAGTGGDSHSRCSRRSNPAYLTAWRGASGRV